MFNQHPALSTWKLLLRIVVMAIMTVSCEISIPADDLPPDTTVFGVINWRNQDRNIDVVFVPDDDYGDLSIVEKRQVFLDDIANLIDEGFYQNNGIASNLVLFNFWYMTETGNVTPPTGSDICPTLTFPDLTDAAFAEVILLVHRNELRDCRFGNRASTEPTSFRTVVHESSHAIFNMPDEYCCDGGYQNKPPMLYTSIAACTGDAVNVGWRDCVSHTATNGTTWWRSEDSTVDIMSGGGSVVLEYGQADWVIARNRLAGLAGAVVSDPSVFAPDTWDWP